MIHVVTDRFCEEVELYRLKFTCPDCAQFDPVTLSCSLGYPSEPHRAVDLAAQKELIFCKMFELV